MRGIETADRSGSRADADPGLVMPRIGVLALQGDFQAHAAAFAELGEHGGGGAPAPHELAGLDGLVMPGGESTTACST